MTVNEALTLMAHVRKRISQLESIQSTVTKRSIWHNENKSEELQYDPKEVDKKLCDLRKWLMEADMKIKRSNAEATVGMEAEAFLFDSLSRREG